MDATIIEEHKQAGLTGGAGLGQKMDDPYPRLMGNSSGHAMKLKQHLHDQMLAESEFCDVTLTFCGVDMKAHWCVLVACPYFQSLYNSGLRERQQGKVHISIGKLSAIRQAITFLYTGTINLKYSMLKDVLEIADYLQIDDLKVECTNYLNNIEITINNCVHLCLLASLYDLEIYNKVFDYVRGHLPEVLMHPDTLSLTPESIQEMLKDQTLNYVPKQDFFKFIVKWVENDAENRARYFDGMFCELDLKKMPKEFINSDIESCDLVVASEKCKEHILNVKMKHMTAPLTTDNQTEVILLIGGLGNGGLFDVGPYLPMLDLQTLLRASDAIYAYIVAEDRWAELAPLPTQMRNPIVAYKESAKCLYVYDGSTAIPVDDNEAYIHKYDLIEKSWSTIHLRLPAPLSEITIHNIIIVGDSEFVLGAGTNGSTEPNKTQTFQEFLCGVKNDMTQCFSFFGLCKRNFTTDVKVCVAEERFICILCVKCGPSRAKRNKNVKFFLYDAQTRRNKDYSKGVPTDTNSVIFAIKNEVYVTKPGCSKYKKFDINTRRWSAGKETLIPQSSINTDGPARSDFVIGTHKNRLFLFGGKVDKKLVNQASVCEFTNKSWKEIEPIPKPACNSAVITAKIPSSAVACHIDCPHCKFVSIRGQTSYARVEFPEEEDEYDDDLSYDDEDMYSDFWGNDMYDDDMDIYPDYDWF